MDILQALGIAHDNGRWILRGAFHTVSPDLGFLFSPFYKLNVHCRMHLFDIVHKELFSAHLTMSTSL